MSRRLRFTLVGSVLVGLGLVAHTVAAGTISLLGFGTAVLLGLGLSIPISRGALGRAPLVASIFDAKASPPGAKIGSVEADHLATEGEIR